MHGQGQRTNSVVIFQQGPPFSRGRNEVLRLRGRVVSRRLHHPEMKYLTGGVKEEDEKMACKTCFSCSLQSAL